MTQRTQCSNSRTVVVWMDDWSRVLGEASLRTESSRFVMLLHEALSRFPRDVKPINSVTKIELRKRGRMNGLVGLTTYSFVEPDDELSADGGTPEGTQRITFYSELLDRLSDGAAIGVIAHELAHGWLNEHVAPEASDSREKEADDLAREWGYGVYLDALEDETIPI